MSTHPTRLEARVSAQERQQVMLNARIEELGQDMDTSFKQLVQYHIETERQIDTRFNQVDARLDEIKNDVNEIKNNMTAMESRILNAFQQLVTIISTQQPPTE
jgi:chromosome segregation ATPase